ncbi:class I SAM-dependent methyltransferase [Fimbriiglobus ruber]|uniref:SAM-dependent methyltransferase n=1 Tax=Fimbriiglobus ruber TaxID=1908690 RepID=A0A225DAN8_9BACT|nr:class I SAM-dependent methyltransferase [Fimbriiglobus ruber]OWK38640.1 SAM-dependent methyltransferase [Fimbriiglobus ruber]
MKDGFPVRDCLGCGHRFAGYVPPADHVETVYADGYFRGGGAGYPDYLAGAALLRRHGDRYARLVARYAPRPGAVLDVGAAAGFILSGFTARGWVGEGVEPNPAMAAHARDHLGLNVHAGTLDAVPPGPRFDLVSFVQVVAHLPDPLAAFERADELTKPGGLWLVETWDCESLTARFLGPGWHEYSPPSVLHWWTPKVLGATLARLGYRQRGVGKPQKWLGAAHAKSLLRHKAADGPLARVLSRGAALIPDRVAVPYPSEDLFWAVYQKE